MLVKYHIILGAIASTILYLLFQLTPFQTIIIFLSSFLIDTDHYLYYAFKYKNLNLKKSYSSFMSKRKIWLKLSPKQKEEHKRIILIFHGIEFIALLILLSFYNPFFLLILIGVSIHLVFDYIDLAYHQDAFYSKFSQVYVYFNNKTKDKGLI